MATFGIAALLMHNPLNGRGSTPKAAETALAAIEQGRKVGAKTQREWDYIEAVARLRRLHQPPRARAPGLARTGLRGAGREVPEDDEAHIFSALYTAGTQSQADQTYAAYLKAAAVLEKQFVKYPDHPGVAHA